MGREGGQEAGPGRLGRMLQNRIGIVVAGGLLGAVWGLVMWGLTAVLGQDPGGDALVYLVVTMAMIGCGVGAFFGALGVRRRGGRVSPRVRRD